MNERQSDFELLQGCARQGDQSAFTILVRRHLDLVYATALRKVHDQGAAEEVTQNVFAALMRKSWQFAPDDSLPAWLYKTSLLESTQWLRGELRRRAREQTAAELGTTMNTPDEQPALRALVPLLDEALLSLREKDRAALLLRFYENRSLRDVGASFGVGEDAAQKRVAGALEKLSNFFQRRGYKTATVAATTAALEHTALSAPAAVTHAVVLATAKMTPPALAGLTAIAARLAALTQFQAAAVCIMLAVAPVAWQWNHQRQARQQLLHFQTQLAEAQKDLSAAQSEIDRRNEASARLAASSAAAKDAADRDADAAGKFAAWRNHLRQVLTDDDYRWPEDSPFVRIPKSVLHDLNDVHGVNPPGVLRQEARELLGLTPQDRKQIEATLQNHFATMDDLIEKQIVETNQTVHFRIPEAADARMAWIVPPLGDEVVRQGAELQSELKGILGDSRWALMKEQLQSTGINTLRRVLNLDAGNEGQEVAVWIKDNKNDAGQPTVGIGLSSGSSMSITEGLGLDTAVSAMGAENNGNVWDNLLGVPESITQRINEWIKLQGEMRLGKGASK